MKLWSIPRDFFDEIDEEESERFNLVNIIKHPSYVYSVKFVPNTGLNDMEILVTACFDSKIRLYSLDTNNNRNRIDLLNESVISLKAKKYDDFTNLLEHRHPNII